MKSRSRRTHRKAGQTSEKWAVVHDGWKLIHTSPDDTIELYLLRTDPGETRNVAQDHPEQVRRLLDERARFTASARRWEAEASTLLLDPEAARVLQDLGYAGEDGDLGSSED